MKSLQEIIQKGILRKENLAVILLVGVLLLIISLPVKDSGEDEEGAQNSEVQNSTDTAQDWQSRTEKHLAQILGQVNGVGKVEVFLTCESTEKRIVEKDETDTVYEKDAKGNQSPYVASEEYPKVIGVLVAAQGGDNPVVVKNIQEAVQVLFQVEAHKIKVMKMN